MNPEKIKHWIDTINHLARTDPYDPTFSGFTQSLLNPDEIVATFDGRHVRFSIKGIENKMQELKDMESRGEIREHRWLMKLGEWIRGVLDPEDLHRQERPSSLYKML